MTPPATHPYPSAPEVIVTPQLKAALEELDKRSKQVLNTYEPYFKQQVFHAAGKDHRERMLFAGNQLGKSYSGGMEMAYHLTGLYPDWWQGRRVAFPKGRSLLCWAASVTGESTRDNVQRQLMGIVGEIGTGSLPPHTILDMQRARGVADLLDYVKVQHCDANGMPDGVSTLRFKYYEQGREKWQGPTVDIVWFDEEPLEPIYAEGLARTIATGGLVYMTFTPLLGMSNVVRKFLSELSPSRFHITMAIDDALHIPEERRQEIIDSFAPHEREARAKGIPTLGSGAIFPVPPSQVEFDYATTFPNGVPEHYLHIVGLDFGWDHPTAAVHVAIDPETDTAYVVACYARREASVLEHAGALRPWGTWMPIAWPHDGLQHDKGSGVTLAEQYASHGLNMLEDRATFEDGSNGVEAGLMMMLEMMQTERLKIASHLARLWDEMSTYHREEGKVVKDHDDALCLHPDTQVATRKGLRSIEALEGTTGEVLTPEGFRPYHSCRKTRKNAGLVKLVYDDGSFLDCTPDHLILADNHRWVRAIDAEGIFVYNCVSNTDNAKVAEWNEVVSNTEEKPGQLLPKAKRILRVLHETKRSDTYCMEVPGVECFAISNGTIVHNCALRYALMMRREAVPEGGSQWGGPIDYSQSNRMTI